MELGIAFSSEELGPNEIVRAAALAEELDFPTAWVSDHYHPWIDAQGESPFVWSVLGGIAAATERLRVGTGVTCPIMRIHPAILAQAAATTQEMFDGRFWFGVGTGEALNEHILGDKWPEASVRLAMLEEAVELIRELWKGEQHSHYGPYFTVENARVYTLPETPPPIMVSAFGPKALELAARIGDGLVTTRPDRDSVRAFDDAGGSRQAQARAAQGRVGTDAGRGRGPRVRALADLGPRGRVEPGAGHPQALRAGGVGPAQGGRREVVPARTGSAAVRRRDSRIRRRRHRRAVRDAGRDGDRTVLALPCRRGSPGGRALGARAAQRVKP